jgi:hypothetical protein
VVRAHLAGRTAEARATLEGEFAERSRATVAALMDLKHALGAAAPGARAGSAVAPGQPTSATAEPLPAARAAAARH